MLLDWFQLRLHDINVCVLMLLLRLNINFHQYAKNLKSSLKNQKHDVMDMVSSTRYNH
jgi:hypothetical protein